MQAIIFHCTFLFHWHHFVEFCFRVDTEGFFLANFCVRKGRFCWPWGIHEGSKRDKHPKGWILLRGTVSGAAVLDTWHRRDDSKTPCILTPAELRQLWPVHWIIAEGPATDLPHSNDCICNENEKDDKGLHKGSDGLLTLLKPGQHLQPKRRIGKQTGPHGEKHWNINFQKPKEAFVN